MYPSQKEQIIAAFEKTLVNSKAEIEEGTAILLQLKNYEGCCLWLMEIVDDVAVKDPIRQAAAIQLKLTIENRWKVPPSSTTQALTENEKATIRQFLLTAFLRSHRNTKVLPIYRVIVTTIVQNDFKEWLPFNDVLLQIQKDETTIPGCLYYLESVFKGVSGLVEEERDYTENLIEAVFPALYQIIQKEQSRGDMYQSLQVVYLVTKIFWRGYKNCIKQKAMEESFKFMGIVQAVIEYYNPQLNLKSAADIKKYTAEYYYFNSKKWAFRLLWKFLQSHANSLFHETNEVFSSEWFKSFGAVFVECLVKQLPIPCTQKAKFFQLKGLLCVSHFRYEYIDPFAEELLFKILEPFLLSTEEERTSAREDPLEYLRAEEDPVQNFTNTKSAATDLWVQLAGSYLSSMNTRSKGKGKKGSKTQADGKYLKKSMEFLQLNLNSGDNPHKQMAMYLICKLNRVITNVEGIKDQMPLLIQTYVLPHFRSEEMLLRARAAELFSEYGYIDFKDDSLLRQAVDLIYELMTKDPNAMVKLKAAYAFTCVLRHKTTIEMMKPILNDILTVYVGLLEKFETEHLVRSLEGIVAHFADDIGVFAVELVKHIGITFVKYCGKAQNENDQNAATDVEMAAGGCIDTMTRIVNSPLTLNTLRQLEPYIIPVVEVGFTREGADNVNDILYLLEAYISKVDTISPQMWFFYPCILYACTGITPGSTSQSITFSPMQQRILEYLSQQPNSDLFNEALPVIRAYIFKGADILTNQNDFFGNNLFGLLFKSVEKIYESCPEDELKATVTALMIYILENVKQTQQFVPFVWQIIKRNMDQNCYRFLRIINGQLATMCMYVASAEFISTVQAENSLTLLFDYIFHPDSLYHNEWEKQRIVLGLSNVIVVQNRTKELLAELPRVMDQLKMHLLDIYDIRKERINESDQETSSDNGSDEFDSDGALDDCFWEEPREENFKTALDEVDEVAYFEQCFSLLRTHQPEMYLGLISKYSADDRQHLDQAVVKSKEQFAKRREKILESEAKMKEQGIAF